VINMKNDTIIVVGAGLLLLLAMQKKATAATYRTAPGGAAQPGVTYATPTAQAGVIAGAVNGILNWLSGTPNTPPINGNVATPSGTVSVGQGDVYNNPVDGVLGDLYTRAYDSILSSPYITGNDGSVSGSSNVQDGTQLGPVNVNLANFWTASGWGLE
jgi:hypothetical protein